MLPMTKYKLCCRDRLINYDENLAIKPLLDYHSLHLVSILYGPSPSVYTLHAVPYCMVKLTINNLLII